VRAKEEEMKGVKRHGKPWTQKPRIKPTLGASPGEFFRLNNYSNEKEIKFIQWTSCFQPQNVEVAEFQV
jgi:hypothetical protein